MKFELRQSKSWDRCNARSFEYEKYYHWIYSKSVRVRNRWAHVLGSNRSCLDFRPAGYIERKRQIVKCFMKGWRNGYENFKSVRD